MNADAPTADDDGARPVVDGGDSLHRERLDGEELHGDDDGADDGTGSGPGLGYGMLVAIVVVALCLGGAVGWRIGRTQAEPTIPGSGSVDVGFFQDMTRHHEQAIAMAFDYVEHGTDPLMRHFAKEILTYQAAEIGIMGSYLSRWGQNGNEPVRAMEWMGMAAPPDGMPGMASRAEMQELAAARGRDLDEVFTRLMIDHHAGGIHMAQYAVDHAITSEARSWAQAMINAQRGEISELNRWRLRHDMAAVPVEVDGDGNVTVDGHDHSSS